MVKYLYIQTFFCSLMFSSSRTTVGVYWWTECGQDHLEEIASTTAGCHPFPSPIPPSTPIFLTQPLILPYHHPLFILWYPSSCLHTKTLHPTLYYTQNMTTTIPMHILHSLSPLYTLVLPTLSTILLLSTLVLIILSSPAYTHNIASFLGHAVKSLIVNWLPHG